MRFCEAVGEQRTQSLFSQVTRLAAELEARLGAGELSIAHVQGLHRAITQWAGDEVDRCDEPARRALTACLLPLATAIEAQAELPLQYAFAEVLLAGDAHTTPVDIRLPALERGVAMADKASQTYRELLFRTAEAMSLAWRFDEALELFGELGAREDLSLDERVLVDANLEYLQRRLSAKPFSPIQIPEGVSPEARGRALLKSIDLRGDRVQDALQTLDEVLECAWHAQSVLLEASVLQNRAELEFELGHLEVALGDIDEALELLLPDDSFVGAWFLVSRASFRLAQQDVEGALDDLIQARDYSHIEGQRMVLTTTEMLLGDCAARQGQWRAAQRHYATSGRSLGGTQHAYLPAEQKLRTALIQAQRGHLELALQVVEGVDESALTDAQRALWQHVFHVVAGGKTDPAFRIDIQRLPGRSWWLRGWVDPPNLAGVRVARDGSWIERDGERVSLEEGRPLRRVLVRLIEKQPDANWRLTRSEASAVGWPGETVSPRAMKNRVNVTLNRLRGHGLRDYILNDEGWHLAPSVEVV